ncbi:MAG: MMPL family transporter [Acidilobaceae archaeon]
MNARHVAVASLVVWLIIVVIMASQALVLDERLEYDETAFLRRDLESYVGLSKLTEAGILVSARETILVVFKPADARTSMLVEEALRDALREFGGVVVGPHTVYSRVVESALEQLSRRLESALSSYGALVESALLAGSAADALEEGLAKTFGLAELFLGYYLTALQQDHPEPGSYAYSQLSQSIPPDAKPLLDFFYAAFSSYEKTLPPAEAARRAAIDLARSLDPGLAQAAEFFDLSDYRDRDKVLRYVYETTGFREALSFEEFKALVAEPERIAAEIVGSELARVDACLREAFDRARGGESPASAISACRQFVETRLVPFPQGIPEELRLSFISLDGEYALAVGYTSAELNTEESVRVDKAIRERLADYVEELHVYGTISMKTERLRVLQEDTGRIDKIVAASLLLTTIALMGTLSAPLLIFAVTIASLTTAFGAISVAALYTDIYYLARLFIVPLVFSISADYSIYYLFRVVEEREKGRSWSDAVVEAWRRVSIALALGGLTGLAGFSAFIFSGHELLRSIGVALLISVGVAFIASLTLTPAILMLAGERLLAWPRRELRIPARSLGPRLRAVASRAVEHRVLVIVASLAILAVGLYFIVHTPVTQNVYLSFPLDSDFVKASEILFTRFDISRFSTLTVVSEDSLEALEEAVAELESRGVVVWHRVIAVEPYVVLELGIREDPLGDGARRVVNEVRSVLSSYGVRAYVTGVSPLLSDTISDLVDVFYTRTLPIALLLVALVMGILLGSVLQPVRILITAILALLVSLMATSLFFEHYLKLPAFTTFDSLFYWVIPIILWGFAVSTGVDFEAFLTARIREEYEKLGEASTSALEAVEKTGVVISVLAAIYVIAFASLMVSAIPLLKMIGFAIAAFFIVDAFATRLLVVPAYVSTLGRLNWWPRR